MSPAQDTMKDAKSGKEVKAKGITLNVMGREFRVAAGEGEERQLLASVDLLNKKMKEIRESGKVVGNERIAILVALNIAHEHLQAQQGATTKAAHKTAHSAPNHTQNISVDAEYVKRRMREMEGMIEKAISDQEKLF